MKCVSMYSIGIGINVAYGGQAVRRKVNLLKTRLK